LRRQFGSDGEGALYRLRDRARTTTPGNFLDVSSATAPISRDLNLGVSYDLNSAINASSSAIRVPAGALSSRRS